jgi:hypothetical protein
MVTLNAYARPIKCEDSAAADATEAVLARQ